MIIFHAKQPNTLPFFSHTYIYTCTLTLKKHAYMNFVSPFALNR